MKDKASNDLCPPESSESYFLTLLNWTCNSAPFVTSVSSMRFRCAVAPGRRSLNIFPRFSFTIRQHDCKVLVLLSSRSCILLSRVSLSKHILKCTLLQDFPFLEEAVVLFQQLVIGVVVDGDLGRFFESVHIHCESLVFPERLLVVEVRGQGGRLRGLQPFCLF